MFFLLKMSLMHSMLRLLDSPKQTHSKHHGKKLMGEKGKTNSLAKSSMQILFENTSIFYIQLNRIVRNLFHDKATFTLSTRWRSQPIVLAKQSSSHSKCKIITSYFTIKKQNHNLTSIVSTTIARAPAI